MDTPHYRRLFENTPVCILEVDLGPERPEIVAANERARRLYRWAEGELAGRPLDDLLPPGAVTRMARLTEEVRCGRTATVETVHVRHDGSHFPARLRATALSDHEPNRMILIVEDLTAERERRWELEAIDEDRRRIARELHDVLAQNLAALRLRAGLWRRLVDSDPARLHAELETLQEELAEDVEEIRRVIFALRPIPLDAAGFVPSLRRLVDDMAEQYGFVPQVVVHGPDARLPARLELPLLRIVQESLNNAGRHGAPTAVGVTLEVGGEDVVLEVRDDGRGFDLTGADPGAAGGHYGLRLMRERVEGLNGEFGIRSRPGHGTRIRVRMPVAGAE